MLMSKIQGETSKIQGETRICLGVNIVQLVRF